MNKKIFTYILLVFIALFGFNMNVDAANNLTCVYEGALGNGGWKDAFMFVQDSDGYRTYYYNKKTDKPTSDDENWLQIRANGYTLSTDSKYYDLNTGFFTSCPAYYTKTDNVKVGNEKKTAISLYDDKNSSYWQKSSGHNKSLMADNSFSSKICYDNWDTNHTNGYICEKNYLSGSGTNVDNETIIGSASKYVEYTSNATSCDEVNFKDVWLGEPDISTYNVNSCLYCYEQFTLFQGNIIHLIQIDYGNDNLLVSNNFNSMLITTFDAKTLNQSYVGICPPEIFVSGTGASREFVGLSSSLGSNKYLKVRSLDKDTNVPLILESIEITGCEDLLPEEARDFLRFLVKAFQIGIPLLLIGLGIVDFARGVFSSEDEMKKIQHKFIKRIILAVAFYLIPNIIELLLSIASGVWPNIDPGLCGIFEKK